MPTFLKIAQCESPRFSFIGHRLRTIAQETAPQIGLRDCSKEVAGGGGDQCRCDFGEGGVHAVKHIFLTEGFC